MKALDSAMRQDTAISSMENRMPARQLSASETATGAGRLALPPQQALPIFSILLLGPLVFEHVMHLGKCLRLN